MARQVGTTMVVGDLVLADRIIRGGGVLIAGEKIASVHETPRGVDADEIVDFSGCLVMPGIVDSHIHARSSDREGLTRATSAAAAGGVTTVIDMPFDHPDPINDLGGFQRKTADIAHEAVVDVGLYATMPKHEGVGRLRELAQAGACAFKFSMFEVDPERLPRIDNGELLLAFEELAATRVPAVVHAEDQEMVAAKLGQARAAEVADWARHSLSRPVVTETAAVAVLLELAYWSGARLQVAHVTHPHGFDMIDFYRSLGADVSGETCVQYLTLSDEDTVQQFGPLAKINPPLRDRSARDGLWVALNEGRIASVSSDHAPWPRSRKQPPILQAASGMPGLETLLAALFTESTRRNLDWPFVAGFVTWRPAEIFGVGDRKGSLRAGHDADLCLFDPNAQWRFDASASHSVADWSPFDGTTFTGRVVATYVRGNSVYADGQVHADPGCGRWLKAAHQSAPAAVTA